MFVFEPEVEYIAHEVYFRGIYADLVQPFADQFFTLQGGVVIRGSKMEVGSEIYVVFAGYQAQV